METSSKVVRSSMGWSDATTVTVRGENLTRDVMGQLNFGDFAFLEIRGRKPTYGESVVFNALLATLVEHGMTPMVLAARLTHMGSPEALQAAVAAGVLGVGSAFAGTADRAARVLQEALAEAAPDTDLSRIATELVRGMRVRKETIPGVGHDLHKPKDPRAERLFELAADHGLSGRHVALMQGISRAAEAELGKPGRLPVNATGAMGAVASELGIPWQICRGLSIIGRTVGIVGHLAEELQHPIAPLVYQRAQDEASAYARARDEDRT